LFINRFSLLTGVAIRRPAAEASVVFNNEMKRKVLSIFIGISSLVSF
jgi:hypothetical protein